MLLVRTCALNRSSGSGQFAEIRESVWRSCRKSSSSSGPETNLSSCSSQSPIARRASMMEGFSVPAVSMPFLPMKFWAKRDSEGKIVSEGRETFVLLNFREEKTVEAMRKREPLCERGICSGDVGEKSSISENSLGGVGRSWSGVLRR